MAVALDPELMDILACPCDAHAPLRVGTPADPDADVLTCTVCGRAFPVVEGVPWLLLSEALPPQGRPEPPQGRPEPPQGRPEPPPAAVGGA